MRIAVVEPVGGHGGMDYYDGGLCDGLANAGLDVTLYTGVYPTKGRHAFRIQRYFEGVFDTRRGPIWRTLLFTFALLRSLFEIRNRKFDVIHLQWFRIRWLELIVSSLSRTTGARVVATIHDVETLSIQNGQKSNRFATWIRPFVDCWVVHNHSSRRALLESVDVQPSCVQVVPHGNYPRSSEMAPRTQARNQLGLPKEAPVVLFFGQIKKSKGLDLLIDAVANTKDIHLVIAGKPWKTEFDGYRNRIIDKELAQRCHTYIGYVRNEEVPTLFAAVDAIVLPYRRVYQSGVALMAMSYGLPVIASDLEAMKETLTHGKTGFLFETNSPRALTQCLGEVFDDPKRLDEVAARGRRHVERTRCWTAIGAITAEVYRSLFNNDSTRPRMLNATARQIARIALVLSTVAIMSGALEPVPAEAALLGLGILGLMHLGDPKRIVCRKQFSRPIQDIGMMQGRELVDP